MHPDTDLVADILGQRPDAVVPTPVRPPTLSPPHHTRPQQPPVAVARPGEENERPSHLPSFVPPNAAAVEADAQPLLPVPCGGQLIAKVNEVDTLFSPGELILLAPLHYHTSLHFFSRLKPRLGFPFLRIRTLCWYVGHLFLGIKKKKNCFRSNSKF